MYRDLIALGEQMKAAYPEMKLFLFGHSMGSLWQEPQSSIVRTCIVE